MRKPTSKNPSGERRRVFEELVASNQRYLFSAAMRLTSSPTEAEDLLQEALISAYLGFDRFELGTNFRAWALRILRNTHINRYRKRQRQVTTVEWDEVGTDDRPPTGMDPTLLPGIEEEVMRDIPNEAIIPALKQVPDEFRTAVVLSDIHHYSYEEIAEELDIPLGTVRSRIFRGRRRLRELLEDYAREHRLL